MYNKLEIITEYKLLQQLGCTSGVKTPSLSMES